MIGDDTLVTEGELYTPFSGAMLKQMGLPEVDENKHYATSGRAVTFWPFEVDLRPKRGCRPEDLKELNKNLLQFGTFLLAVVTDLALFFWDFEFEEGF